MLSFLRLLGEFFDNYLPVNIAIEEARTVADALEFDGAGKRAERRDFVIAAGVPLDAKLAALVVYNEGFSVVSGDDLGTVAVMQMHNNGIAFSEVDLAVYAPRPRLALGAVAVDAEVGTVVTNIVRHVFSPLYLTFSSACDTMEPLRSGGSVRPSALCLCPLRVAALAGFCFSP